MNKFKLLNKINEFTLIAENIKSINQYLKELTQFIYPNNAEKQYTKVKSTVALLIAANYLELPNPPTSSGILLLITQKGANYLFSKSEKKVEYIYQILTPILSALVASALTLIITLLTK